MYIYEALATHVGKERTRRLLLEFDAPNDEVAVATAPWRIGNAFNCFTKQVRVVACYKDGRRRVVSDEL